MANYANGAAQTEHEPKPLEGRVRFWHADRGYGWIEAGGALSCWFVHIDDVADRVELKIGQRVAFVPTRNDRGPRASAVRLIEENR